MIELQSIGVQTEIYDVDGQIKLQTLSPNDDYLQTWFRNHQEKQNYVEIIELLTGDVIFSMAYNGNSYIPRIKFKKDSKYFFFEYCQRLSLKNLQTRKSLFISKLKSPIYDINELKYGSFLYADGKQIKICKKNKMIRKIILPQSNYFLDVGYMECIDYNPIENLILIDRNYKLIIFSLVKLRIFTYQHLQSDYYYEDLCICLNQASFFQNGVVTLERRGEVKYWEFNYQNQSFVEKLTWLNQINFQSIQSIQVICQDKYVALIFECMVIIIDKRFQIIKKITADIGFENMRRTRSKHKICYSYSQNTIEILTLSEI